MRLPDFLIYGVQHNVGQSFFRRMTRKDPHYWRANIGCLEGTASSALDFSLLDDASTPVVDDA
ncbi:MAG: hypothetical protein JWR14_2259 [Caballeronia sp.]|jgi:hypothetical protein|uniref:hypothetical protein n=1 Tax=Caballeronia sp. TaxID=1931223 RepID=UPI00261CEE3C|nr:hypothetical protein [Caballeronia sp.]MDB5832429.1 hypothetical protein [Caballeronia sp.]